VSKSSVARRATCWEDCVEDFSIVMAGEHFLAMRFDDQQRWSSKDRIYSKVLVIW
jgi:hypothetical protein